MARYETLAGYHAAARRHLVTAHRLKPKDQNIRFQWIESLDQKPSLDELTKFVQESKTIDDRRRKTLLKAIVRLESDQDNHCELAVVDGPVHIPMVPIYSDVDPSIIASYGLELSFNGRKRILQIDTGAHGILLSHTASNGLGLTKVDTGVTGGIGNDGATGTTIYRADSLRVGNLEFKNCTVESLVNFGFLGLNTEIGEHLDAKEGLVGADIFNRYLVTLDYLKHEIRLDPIPQNPKSPTPAAQLDVLGGSNDPNWMSVDRYIAPSMQSWTKVYRDGHQLYIPTRINSLPGNRLFLVDTGAFTSMIDTATAKLVTKNFETGDGAIGLSGAVSIGESGKFTLDFAGMRLPVKSMATINMAGADFKGFIGYPTLSGLVIHIDYRDNLMTFDAPHK